MKNPPFVTGEYYHIYNRGVEKRPIFLTKEDYFRFIFGLYEFNDEHQVVMRLRRSVRKNTGMAPRPPRVPLVEILCFCLMPNHYHLLLRQVKDDGITLFLKKLGIGYTLFFNIIHGRSGYLFQGNAKAKIVTTDTYLLHLSRYIHLNPVESREIPQSAQQKDFNQSGDKFLITYRWSSYLDYIGIENFPSLTSRTLLHECIGGEEKYKAFVENEISVDRHELKDFLFNE